MFNLFKTIQKRNLEGILREANLTMDLYDRLNEIQRMREKHYKEYAKDPHKIAITELTRLGEFFGIMSEVYDKRNIIYELKKSLEKKDEYLARLLHFFYAHLENCGRDEFGMNRTREGEKVTEDNVYVGGKFGLNTYNIRGWIEKLLYEKNNDVGERLATMIKIYLDSHIDPLRNTIRGIYNHLKENKYVVIEKKDKKTGETYFEIKKKKK